MRRVLTGASFTFDSLTSDAFRCDVRIRPGIRFELKEEAGEGARCALRALPTRPQSTPKTCPKDTAMTDRHCPLFLAALALSSTLSAAGATAADLTRSFAVGVDGCDAAQFTQFCTPVPTVALPTDGVLMVAFSASNNHCSAIIAHLLVDGVERFASGALQPGHGTAVKDFGPIAAG